MDDERCREHNGGHRGATVDNGRCREWGEYTTEPPGGDNVNKQDSCSTLLTMRDVENIMEGTAEQPCGDIVNYSNQITAVPYGRWEV